MDHITHEERAAVYIDAAVLYGIEHQLVVAIEELGELQKELCKFLRCQGDLGHMAEEIADATIVLEQVRRIFKVDDMVADFMDAKVTRLAKDIKKDKEGKR